MAGYRITRPVDPHVLVAEVVGTKRVSPHVVRVTLGGEGLGLLTVTGFDQWFRLFLHREGQDTLSLPSRTSKLWYAQYLATPRARRPWVRSYTIRASRPDLREIDVDLVVHGEDDGTCGPAASFALAARPGDTVGLLDQGMGFNPRHEHDAVLLVADETGLPAVAGVLESLPDDARGLALVELPSAVDAQDVRVPAGVELRWVPRDETADPHAVPGVAALAALTGATLPEGVLYAYLVGEQALVTGGRRHLVNERGVPKAHVDFIGYWRHGHAGA